MSTKPTVLALIVCDEIIDDRVTNKKSLIGMFNNIRVHALPSMHHQLVVYVAMTGHGTVPVRVELVRADDITEESGPVLRMDNPGLTFEDPNAVVEAAFKLNGIVFPEAGLYNFRVLSGNHLLAQREFRVHQIEGDQG